MGIPYTGSDALAVGLALHKDRAKELLKARGIPTPEFLLVERMEDLKGLELKFPLIVKPAREDASAGIDFDSVVESRQALERVSLRVLKDSSSPPWWKSSSGREIYVPPLGNGSIRSLPLTEICFGKTGRGRASSYKAKWTCSPASGTAPVPASSSRWRRRWW